VATNRELIEQTEAIEAKVQAKRDAIAEHELKVDEARVALAELERQAAQRIRALREQIKAG
jgi:hypothetical protein